MAAQRLVSELCQHCKKAVTPTPIALKAIEEEIAKLPPHLQEKYKPPYKVFQSEGCAKCQGKGAVGRLAIFEAFKMTPQLAEIIATGFSESKLWKEAERQGIITLRQDGILKALEGLVTIEDILRETGDL